MPSQKKVEIADRLIGKGESCFIIAEAGSNHDQKLSQAKKLVDIAAGSGADAVKFQTFLTEKTWARVDAEFMNIDMAGSKNIYDFYKKIELPREWQGELRDYAGAKGIVFLSTPFDEEAVDQLDILGVPAFKVASFELVHLPLLKHIARKGKPVILSTAMADLEEIQEAIEAILREGNDQIALLHCGVGYPLKAGDVNLAAMDTLRQVFSYPVGYSDHTLGLAVPFAAVARGASIIEKHFTISRSLPGGDHYFALEPHELRDMVRGIREIETAIGSPRKVVLDSELIHHKRARRSIFAKAEIPKDTTITGEMLAVLRPGIGLKPKYLDTIIGRKARVNIKVEEPITWDKVYDAAEKDNPD